MSLATGAALPDPKGAAPKLLRSWEVKCQSHRLSQSAAHTWLLRHRGASLSVKVVTRLSLWHKWQYYSHIDNLQWLMQPFAQSNHRWCAGSPGNAW